MLPRVSAAISQFIAPLSSAATRTSVESKKEDSGSGSGSGFQRHSKKNLKLVEPLPLSDPATPEPEKQALQARRAPPIVAVSHAFIQLLNMLQKHRGSFMKWLGPRAYRAALKEQKQAGKFRKGAMLDIKAK